MTNPDAEKLVALAEFFEMKAAGTAELQPSGEFVPYWRGYRIAFSEAAEICRARAQSKGEAS